MDYQFSKIEEKWQRFWAANKSFKTGDDAAKPKYYVLDMFPYPSGAGLHVGHPLGYIASDIVSRYKRLKGFNVLHPMGYDSFGLPAEQYAIQTGQHPSITTKSNIDTYRRQLDKMGFSYDWDREVRTSDPSYYRWTQWIFIQLFNSWYNKNTNKAESIDSLITIFKTKGNASVNAACEPTEVFDAAAWVAKSEKEQQTILLNYRLAYLSEAWVNWCPALGTVLANDEVKDGFSERGGHPVERKRMPQWSLRITAYAERLLEGLDRIDWPEAVKEMQRNWIGKSEGASIAFSLQQVAGSIEVFSTRPDTIFGCSFLVLAPEHELVAQLTTAEQKTEIEAYIEKTKSRSERDRQADVKTVSGAFTGAYAIHPFTGKAIPVWIADYVLAGYGTGAVMAVPAHDSRDYAFAKHFNLPIQEVVAGGDVSKEAYEAKEGQLIHSDFLNGLEVKAALKKAIQAIEEKGQGQGKVNFRLRDAAFGRQRYWGEPIPVYFKDDLPYVVDEKELPLVLPEIDKFLPTETGEPPLARAAGWKYETTTMPGWAGSSWYFLRYMDAHNNDCFASKQAVDYWQEVDLYLGGAEHATGHLLYVRFWAKFLFDLGLIPKDEPAKKLINQGMIQGRSNFIYSVILQGYRNGEFESGDIGVLVSKNIAERINESPELKEKVSKIISSEVVDYDKYMFAFDSPPTWLIQRKHVDVKYVDQDVLSISTLRLNTLARNDVFILEKDGEVAEEKEGGKYICGVEVEKMSKSKWNVVNPDDIIAKYGADTLRMYEMFLGPLEQSKPWNTNGIEGVFKFLRKFWRLFHNEAWELNLSLEAATPAELKTLHKTIKKVEEDIERFSFNTSVSNFMICVNELNELKCNKKEILEPLVILLSPYAPHIAEELWTLLGNVEGSLSYAPFPKLNESYLVENSYDYPIQVNGKMRGKISFALDTDPAIIEKAVLELEEVQRHLNGTPPKKVIVVKGRIINVVV